MSAILDAAPHSSLQAILVSTSPLFSHRRIRQGLIKIHLIQNANRIQCTYRRFGDSVCNCRPKRFSGTLISEAGLQQERCEGCSEEGPSPYLTHRGLATRPASSGDVTNQLGSYVALMTVGKTLK
jgi:hypothetical protein